MGTFRALEVVFFRVIHTESVIQKVGREHYWVRKSVS